MTHPAWQCGCCGHTYDRSPASSSEGVETRVEEESDLLDAMQSGWERAEQRLIEQDTELGLLRSCLSTVEAKCDEAQSMWAAAVAVSDEYARRILALQDENARLRASLAEAQRMSGAIGAAAVVITEGEPR